MDYHLPAALKIALPQSATSQDIKLPQILAMASGQLNLPLTCELNKPVITSLGMASMALSQVVSHLG